MFASRDKPGLAKRVREFVWPSMGLRRAWHYRMRKLARMKVSPHALALGFAAGAFASFTPFIGLHFIMAIVVAFLVRGNILAAAIGTVIGNPLTLPFIWIASYNVGAEMLGMSTKADVPLNTDLSVGLFSDGPLAFAGMVWRSVEPVIWPMVLGGVPLGLLTAAISYWLVYVTMQKFRSRTAARA